VAAGQVAQFEWANTHADEPLHGMPDSLAHAADLPLAALMKHQPQPTGLGAGLLKQDPVRGGQPVFQVDALPQLLQQSLAGHSPHQGAVLFLVLVPGVSQQVRQLSIVGQKDQPLAVQVQRPTG